MSNRRVIRVGGVPEHFNLPWLLAIDEDAFADLSVSVEWIDFPGGTGAIMAALADGDIDMATPLTEGLITAIANGNPSKLISIWVDSPLLWGVHAAGNSSADDIDDLEGQRFAISRYGSGSDLMSRVMAQDFDWQITDDNFVPVGNLDGALKSLPAGEAEIFMWNMSMTQPHVDDGTFKRVGVFPTPWPSFAVAASQAFVDNYPGLAESTSQVARARAEALEFDESLAQFVVQRYGLDFDGAIEWVKQVNWTSPDADIDEALVDSIADRMRSIGRIS